MPVVSSPAPGTFCWVELKTTDVAAARQFYGDIFGWSIAELPGETPYGLASLDGAMTAGITALTARAKSLGAPPHWLPYVAVDDVQAATDRAVSLGGRVLTPPTTMGPGTFSVMHDPTSAAFAVWHAPQATGGFLSGEPGSLGWSELVSTDASEAGRFYTSLFGWTCHSANMPGTAYSLFTHEGEAIAGLMPMPQGEPPGARSHWNIYFAVEDADQTVDEATDRGAHIALPLMNVPTVGRLGFLTDPQGVMFAVIAFEGKAS